MALAMLRLDNLAKLNSLSQWLAGRAHVTGVTSVMMLPQTASGQAIPADQLEMLYYYGRLHTESSAGEAGRSDD